MLALQVLCGLLHTSLRSLHQLQAKAGITQILCPTTGSGDGRPTAAEGGAGRHRGRGTPARPHASPPIHTGASKAPCAVGTGHGRDERRRKGRYNPRRRLHHHTAVRGSGGGGQWKCCSRTPPKRVGEGTTEGGAEQIHRGDATLPLHTGGEGRKRKGRGGGDPTSPCQISTASMRMPGRAVRTREMTAARHSADRHAVQTTPPPSPSSSSSTSHQTRRTHPERGQPNGGGQSLAIRRTPGKNSRRVMVLYQIHTTAPSFIPQVHRHQMLGGLVQCETIRPTLALFLFEVAHLRRGVRQGRPTAASSSAHTRGPVHGIRMGERTRHGGGKGKRVATVGGGIATFHRGGGVRLGEGRGRRWWDTTAAPHMGDNGQPTTWGTKVGMWHRWAGVQQRARGVMATAEDRSVLRAGGGA